MPQCKSVGQKCFDAVCNSGPVCKKTKLEGEKQMITDRQCLPKGLLEKQCVFSLGKSGQGFARRDLQGLSCHLEKWKNRLCLIFEIPRTGKANDTTKVVHVLPARPLQQAFITSIKLWKSLPWGTVTYRHP